MWWCNLPHWWLYVFTKFKLRHTSAICSFLRKLLFFWQYWSNRLLLVLVFDYYHDTFAPTGWFLWSDCVVSLGEALLASWDSRRFRLALFIPSSLRHYRWHSQPFNRTSRINVKWCVVVNYLRSKMVHHMARFSDYNPWFLFLGLVNVALVLLWIYIASWISLFIFLANFWKVYLAEDFFGYGASF